MNLKHFLPKVWLENHQCWFHARTNKMSALYKWEDATLYKTLNCVRAKSPAIDHCLFDVLKTSCGTLIQLKKSKQLDDAHMKLAYGEEYKGITQFWYDYEMESGYRIPFELIHSTGGIINVMSKCHCTLCLFDPSWFYCHCSKCLPTHAFHEVPDPYHCPYLNAVKPHIRVYRNYTLIEKGWAHQMKNFSEKCCCIFHPCEINSSPCLCKRCVLDFTCDCMLCQNRCGTCGDTCDIEKARNEIKCTHLGPEQPQTGLGDLGHWGRQRLAGGGALGGVTRQLTWARPETFVW